MAEENGTKLPFMVKLVAASFNCEWNPVFGRSKVISSTGCNKIIVQSMFRSNENFVDSILRQHLSLCREIAP